MGPIFQFADEFNLDSIFSSDDSPSLFRRALTSQSCIQVEDVITARLEDLAAWGTKPYDPTLYPSSNDAAMPFFTATLIILFAASDNTG